MQFSAAACVLQHVITHSAVYHLPLQVLAYVEQQPGGPEALKQQLEAMDARWQQYRQDMMAGRPPQQQQQAPLHAPVPLGAVPAVSDGLVNLPYQQQQQLDQQQHLGPGGAAHPDTTGALGFSDEGGLGLGLGLGFDEDHMFDDPTGLGGLSPIAPPAARAVAAPAVQKQGSLGFGMAGGVSGSSAGGDLSGQRLQAAAGVGAMQLPNHQQQQQQQQRFNSGPSSASLLQQQQRSDLQAFMTKYNSSSDRGVGRSGSDAAAAAPTTDYSYWIQQGDITAAQADPRTRRHQGSMMQTTASVAASGRVQGQGFAQGMVPPGAQTLNPAGGSGSGFGWEGLGQAVNPTGSFALPPGLGGGGLPNHLQQQQQQQFGGSRVSVLDRLGPSNQDDLQQQQQQQQDRARSSRHESPPASLRGGGGSSSKRGRSPEASPRGHLKLDSSRDRAGRKEDKEADKKSSKKEKKEKKEKERERDSSR
jgi:hypothetical protein